MPNQEAIRSDSAENEAWYLISPIAWRRLAQVYADPNLVRFTNQDFALAANLNEVLSNIRIYLYGSRDDDYLAKALLYLCEYFDYEALGHHRVWSRFSANLRYDAISPIGLKRVAERYRLGEKKYSAYNCELGFPIYDLLNHAIRHIKMHLAGQEDEPGDDNLGGVAWGLCMAMHSEEMWPHLNEGTLREPGCTITEGIKAKINEDRELKSHLPKDFDYHNHTLKQVLAIANDLKAKSIKKVNKK